MAAWEFLPTRWRRFWGFCLQDGGNAAFLESFTHKMAAREICVQDGNVSESFTHKMAA